MAAQPIPSKARTGVPGLDDILAGGLTKGRVFDFVTVDKLDDAIAMREVTQTLEDREELWDAPLLYATIVLGLTAEWVLRKVFRMI